MRQVRLTPQAIKDLKDCDSPTREQVKEALRHLAEHPFDGKPLKGHFQKDKVWSYQSGPIVFSTAVPVPIGWTCSPSNTAKMSIGS